MTEVNGPKLFERQNGQRGRNLSCEVAYHLEMNIKLQQSCLALNTVRKQFLGQPLNHNVFMSACMFKLDGIKIFIEVSGRKLCTNSSEK